MNEDSSKPSVRSFRKRKRSSRPSWKDLPAYLDKSATVSVSLFSSRRLPELKELQAQLRTASKEQTGKSRKRAPVQPEDSLQSGGAKTSSRHLRRRTTAVERKKHKHRFPLGDKRPKSQPKTRKGNRGNKSTLCQGHLEWRHGSSRSGLAVASTTGTTTTSKATVNWMVTHLWHAKRFHMETLWGWRVPLCHSNRGARAMLRLEHENRCSLQDVTWRRQTVAISSTLPLSSLAPSLSRVCPDFATSQEVLVGMQMGSGMLHHLDQFPMQAIGPIRWKVSSEKDSKASRWIVQFFVHPSIYADLIENLQQIMVEESKIQFEESSGMIGNSCFQLCGSSATSIIQSALQPKQEDEKTASWNWYKVPNQQSAETCLPHGSVFRVTVDLVDNASKTTRTKNPVDDDDSPSLEGLNAHMNQVRRYLEHVNLETGDGVANRPAAAKANEILLIWQSPRELNCSPNRAVSGWEIHCSDIALAQMIWMKLVLAGPCCPMGMAEETHLRLECSPPLPVFPRDYVDTVQGQLYWNGDVPGEAQSKKGTSWGLIRCIWEGGSGRLPKKCPSFDASPIHWNRLASIEDNEQDNESSKQVNEEDRKSTGQEVTTDEGEKEDDESSNGERDCSTVVVRGAFTQPFLQALQGCGQQPAAGRSETSSILEKASIGAKKLRNRNRRRARPLNEMQKSPPLSKQQSDVWKESCFGLRSSLSLPALLVCHVQVAGKGVLQSGDAVYFEAICLGHMTTASFSLSRGTCHGLAVVGAARLLNALETSNSNAGRHVRLLDGSRSLQLAVTLHAGDMHCLGSLSIA